MAGMLPGVEAARRRRFHQKNNHFYASELSPATTTSRYGSCSTRRSSLCLYVSSHEFRLCSSNSSMRSGLCDESRLGVEAREAKKRLDERLQAKWRSETTRSSIGESRSRSSLQEMPMQGSEVPKMKKNGSTKLRWLKLSWKSSEQEECAVCLEQLKAAAAAAAPEALMQLGCGHRFHRNCLVPWLEANGPCPCCRTEVPS